VPLAPGTLRARAQYTSEIHILRPRRELWPARPHGPPGEVRRRQIARPHPRGRAGTREPTDECLGRCSGARPRNPVRVRGWRRRNAGGEARHV